MVATLPLPHEDLQYWLSNEDWYPSRYTQNWLKNTPPDEAADILNCIAEDAQPEPPGLLSRIATLFATSGFATSSAIAGGGPQARKAGVRAALLLASRNDPRAIAPLVRVFDPYGAWQSKYQSEIEAALTRLLVALTPAASANGAGTSRGADVRQLAERILRDSRKRGDLSGPLAELLIAAFGYLHAADGDTNRVFLEGTATALSAATTFRSGNRARAKASLLTLLGWQ